MLIEDYATIYLVFVVYKVNGYNWLDSTYFNEKAAKRQARSLRTRYRKHYNFQQYEVVILRGLIPGLEKLDF